MIPPPARIHRKPSPRVRRPLLEIPLEMKLLGANLVIVATLLLLMIGPTGLQPEGPTGVYVVLAGLTVAAIVNLLLVKVALRPIESLERFAKWVSEGRLAQSVAPFVVTDPALTRLSRTINEMLDSLAAGREQMEKLRAEVTYAAERERFAVAQELHYSAGQKLADASFQISAAANEMKSSARSSRLREAQLLLRTAINEIRGISHAAHPHVRAYPGLPDAFPFPHLRAGTVVAYCSTRGSLPRLMSNGELANVTQRAPNGALIFHP